MYPSLELMGREEIRKLQERRLVRLVDRLWNTNPFYRERWSKAGVRPGVVRRLEDLRHLPLIGKEDLIADQEEAPPYGRRLGVRADQVFETTLSSGTSGFGQEVHAHTARDAHLRGALHAISFWWGGARPKDIISFHIGISNTASHGSLHRGLRAAGRLPYLIGHLSFDQRLDLLREHGVDFMYAMPSALNGLTLLCEKRGGPPREFFPRLRALFMSAEAYPVEFVERMEEAWGVPLYEGYGASQTYGCYIMSNCEFGAVRNGQRGALHMYEWAAVLEVLHPDSLEPVSPGEAGDLVVTLLEKEASPIVRFRTRDKVVWYPWMECPCGRQLDFIESGTIGRWDDMIKIKGQNVFPQQIDQVMFSSPQIGEYQARFYIGEKGRDEAEIKFALAEGTRLSEQQIEALVERLRSNLKQMTNVTFGFAYVPLETLPRYTTPDAKPRRLRDERHDTLRTGRAGGKP
jgi:phenylacetate-CoA ligase